MKNIVKSEILSINHILYLNIRLKPRKSKKRMYESMYESNFLRDLKQHKAAST